MNENSSVTKQSILSQLSAIYNPLGVISPTIVEGKCIYREAYNEKTSWNSEMSNATRQDLLKWNNQLRNLPKSIVKDMRKITGAQLHIFANASNTAGSAATVVVAKHSTGFNLLRAAYFQV